MNKYCPACKIGTLRIEGNGFFSCACGNRVHQAYFDRDSVGEKLKEREPEDPPLPTDRKEAAWMVHDIVMAATEIITRMHEAGLIAGNPDLIRQSIAETANDAVYAAWNPKSLPPLNEDELDELW